MLADAVEGAPRSAILRSRGSDYAGAVARIAGGSWRGRAWQDIRASGYAAHSMEASLWCMGRTGNYYRSAVLIAANLGEDADTTAAITGQLAGAPYGASGIPTF